MSQEFEPASSDAGRARLYEIVRAVHESESLDELAANALDALQFLLPFECAFFLFSQLTPPHLICVEPRNVPAELQGELNALDTSREFLDAADARVSLAERVKTILRAHKFESVLSVPLTARATVIGLLVMAQREHSSYQAWETDAARQEFLARVGADIGVAAQQTLERETARASEVWLRDFLDQLENGYWETDGQGRITRVNDAALRTLKRSRAEVLGKRIDELSDADTAGLAALRALLQRDGIARDFHLRVRASDDEIRLVRQTVRLLRDARGQVTGNQGIFRDITERQRMLDMLAQRNQELLYLHEIALQLREPLDVAAALEKGLDLISDLTHAQARAIFLINPQTSTYTIAAHRGVNPQFVTEHTNVALPRDNQTANESQNATRLLESLMREPRSIDFKTLRALPHLDFANGHGAAYRSGFVAPIGYAEHIYGAAMIAAEQEGQLDEHDLQLLENISAQLGLALHNQNTIAHLELQVKQFQAVLATGEMFANAQRAQDVLPRVMREMREALAASYVVLHILKGERFEYAAASDTRESKRTFPISSYEKRLLESDEPLIVQDREAPTVDAAQRVVLARLGMRAAFGVRLAVTNQPIGMLFVNQETARVWSEHDTRVIAAFTHQIARALENQQLLDNLNRQIKQVQTLARVARFIATESSQTRALATVADEIARVFEADYASFHMRQENQMCLVAQSHELGAPPVLPILPHQLLILDELAPLCVSDREQDAVSEEQREHLRRYNIVADLGVPLVEGNTALGILYICYRTAHAWTDAEVQLAETFAQQIASALVNARLLRETKMQVLNLRSLARNTSQLSFSRSLETTLPNAASDLRRLLEADYVGFHLLEGGFLRIVTEAHHNLTGFKYVVQAYHYPVLHEFQKIVTVDCLEDPKDDKHRQMLLEHDLRADLGVPIVSRGKCIGILFASQKEPRRWRAAEIQLVESYAQQIATTLELVQQLNQTEARLRELEKLVEINDLATAMPDEETLMDIALNYCQDLLNADRTTLLLIKNKKFLAPRSSDGLVYSNQPPPPLEILEKIFRDRQPLILNRDNLPATDGNLETRMEFHQAQTSLSLPMATAIEDIGLVTFIFTKPREFTKPEIRAAQEAANQLAMAFANARLVQDKEIRIQKLMQLADFGLWCAGVHDSATLVKQALEKIRAILDIQGASIRLAQDGVLTVGESVGYTHPESRAHPISIHPSLQRVLQQQKPFPIHDLANEPNVPPHWRERHLQEGFNSLLMVPMLAEGKVLGILTLFLSETHEWETSEMQYAQALGNTLALALTNTRHTEKIAQQGDELRATVDSVFSGVFATDAEGKIRSWNRAAYKMTGFTEQEMLDKQWEVDGPVVGTQRRADTIVLEAMMANDVQFSIAPRYFTCADGSEIQLREAAAPFIGADGKLRGVVCSFWDRTTEQAAERAKIELMTMLGHQLGNKIGTVLTSGEELGRSTLRPSRRREHMNIIANTRRELISFNKQLAAYQIEHMQEQIEETPIDLRELVHRKLVTWRATDRTHRFRMRGTFDFVLGDELRLDVALENLLDNAVKYSPKGSYITVHARCPKPDELILTVHNRGKPIPPELQARIFERGQRGDSKIPGSGLGLWLARIKLHEIGGDISVTSTARRGTSFHLTLRRALAPMPSLNGGARNVSDGGQV